MKKLADNATMFDGPGGAVVVLNGPDGKFVGDFDGFEAQLRKTGIPSWMAYDLRVMLQGYLERGFSNTEDQTARFAALLGHQPRTYSSFAEELAKEWAAAR